MKRPIESEYTSFTSYTRALEWYCNSLEQQPQREWVALTGDDIDEVWRGGEMVLPWDMERTLAIEKILKEKNT